MSRALASSLNVTNHDNKYYNLTIGRVQGPTLRFVVDREIKISGHVPDPIWYITGKFEKDDSFFKANLISVIHNSSDTEKILSACKSQTGTIDNIVKFDKIISPPTPFNVSNLQKEAYRIFKMSPATTLSIAESLYLAALISYPRTSSQKLPPSIGYKQILERLKINYFQTNENIVNDILKREYLTPYQGKEEDPAHPAIYPTGVKQKKLNVLQLKILDLIIKRFLSTFGNNAVTKYSEVTINVNGYYFLAKANAILHKGWIPLYEPYFSINESNLPELKISEPIKVNEIKASEDYTRPPARYNQASLLDKMESEGIGTKSTRAAIINLLIKRKYIFQDKDGIEPTELGFTILNTMKKFVSEIISTKLTSSLESSIKKIQEGDLEIGDVRVYLEKALSNPINEFKLNESTIGDEIKKCID
ncbi:MAG: DNA topoisomerase [Nitrososphaeraceae archaeon]|nr:DNA topoisomerase [Nitrososphaeraceae archaeon]